MKYNCAVIGLGRIGCEFDLNPNSKLISSHVGAYLKNSKTNLSSICDIEENKILKFGKMFNVKNCFTNYYDMLQNGNLDIISICTWPESHANIVEEAVKNNVKGIFLEKPISNSLPDARKILKLCKKNNVKLQIDFQRRFDPIFHNIKKIINQNNFSEIQLFNIYYGGGINNTGSHICDLIRYFFGEIKYAQGNISKNKSHDKSDPNIDGILYCKSGVKCNIHSLDYRNFGLIEFDIIGTKYRIKINLTNGSSKFYEVGPPQKGLVYNELIPKPLRIPKKSSSILNGLNDLIKSIETNTEPLSTGYDGYCSLEAVLSLIKSSKNNGKKISIIKKPIPIKSY